MKDEIKELLSLTSIGFNDNVRYRETDHKGVCEKIKNFIIDNLISKFDLEDADLTWSADYNPEDLGEENTTVKINVSKNNGKLDVNVTIWYPGAFYDCGDCDNDEDDYDDTCEMHDALSDMFDELDNTKPLFVPL